MDAQESKRSHYRRPLRIEALEPRQMLAADFGDAPAPYPTLLVSNGASHEAIGPILGSLRTTEEDGAASPQADADIGDDGVDVVPLTLGDFNATLTVHVSNAPAGAVLDAWIDFNRDGSWSGARERIANSLAVQDGENQLRIEIPGDAYAGSTYARFRLSTNGVASPFGGASDGEVEDYLVEIAPPSEKGGVVGEFQVIADSPEQVDFVEAVDVNGDGSIDFISSSMYYGIYWYERSGDSFTVHPISIEPYYERHPFAVADIDGDGDVDLVSTGEEEYSTCLHVNDGTGQFTTITIHTHEGDAYSIEIGDLDNDGDLDIVTMGDNGSFWLEHVEAQTWQPHQLSEKKGGLTLVDLDRDGDLDIVGPRASTLSTTLLWYQNDRAAFIERSIEGLFAGNSIADAADVDHDGDLDLLVYAQQSAAVLTNDGDFNFSSTILYESTYRYVASQRFADLNGDGNLEAVVRNAGVYDPITGSELPFGTGIAIYDFDLADMDNDGDLDVVTAGGDDYQLGWLESGQGLVELWPNNPNYRATLDESATDTSHWVRVQLLDWYEPSELPGLQLDVQLSLGGSAEYGVDYEIEGNVVVDPVAATVTVPLVEGRLTEMSIRPLDDGNFELDEDVVLKPISTSRIVFTAPDPSFLKIIDDDPADFGDAPASYHVDRERNGAKHGATGPVLGFLRDEEQDGQTSADAGAEEDDGVSFGTLRIGSYNNQITIVTSNVQETAYVDAWIDFDGDGTWTGGNEQILLSEAVVDGSNVLQFYVPPEAKLGTTFARIRLSTTANLSPYDGALDGEVEDYLIEIQPPLQGTGVIRGAKPVYPSDQYVYDVVPADLDQDGDTDLVISSEVGIGWLENDGRGNFVREHTIDNTRGATGELLVADTDRDGDLDLLAITQLQLGSQTILWYENDELTFTATTFGAPGSRYSNLWTELFYVDFDTDGDLDLTYGSKWYEYTDGGLFDQHNLSFGTTEWNDILLSARDLDHDGDVDVLSGFERKSPDITYWLDNQGDQKLEPYDTFGGARRVSLGYLDYDEFLDVLTTGPHGSLSWTELEESAIYRGVIPSGSADYQYAVITDLNADGKSDIISTAISGGGVGWYEGAGDGSIEPHSLSRELDKQAGTAVADYDNDGDLDLITWGTSGQQPSIYIYEQVSTAVQIETSTSAISESTSENAYVTVRRTGMLDRELTVEFELSGTALLGSDYLLAGDAVLDGTTGVLQFGVGEVEKVLSLSMLDDAVLESNEVIKISVVEGVDYMPDAAAGTATIAAIDNEPGDFGDAPSPYPTLLTQDGPRHGNSGPKLGAVRDEEPNGTPADSAQGDDSQQLSDEDGLLASYVQVGSQQSYISISVSDAPAGAYVEAWIDFNHDGTWAGIDERIAHAYPVVEGENVIVFDVPADAVSGESFVRLRVTSTGGIGFVGAAEDGEVEDHVVAIEPPSATAGNFGEALTIKSGTNYVSLFHADLDGDGDIDLISKTVTSSGLLWHENNGRQSFNLQVAPGISGNNYGFAAADVTGDGQIDIVVRDRWTISIYSFMSGEFHLFKEWSVAGGAGGFTSDFWITPLDTDGNGSIELVFLYESQGVLGLNKVDVDGDPESPSDRIADGFFKQPIATDFDGDGDVDLIAILASGSSRDSIYLLESDGRGGFTPRFLTDSLLNIESVNLDDTDGDGDQDLIVLSRGYSSGSDRQIDWFENEGGTIRDQVVLVAAPHLYNVCLADIDGDGDRDILFARYTDYDQYYLKAIGSGFAIPVKLIEGDNQLLSPVDLDGDGDLDLVSSSQSGHPIVWHPNLATPAGDYDRNGTVDQLDYAVWKENFGRTFNPPADGNRDGRVDLQDYTVWRNHFGASAAAADFDLSGVVDDFDYLLWQETFGSQTDLRADGNRDGIVDFADYTLWRNNLGLGKRFLYSAPELTAPMVANESETLRSATPQLSSPVLLPQMWRETSSDAISPKNDEFSSTSFGTNGTRPLIDEARFNRDTFARRYRRLDYQSAGKPTGLATLDECFAELGSPLEVESVQDDERAKS